MRIRRDCKDAKRQTPEPGAACRTLFCAGSPTIIDRRSPIRKRKMAKHFPQDGPFGPRRKVRADRLAPGAVLT
jgi:hypothetical protein